MFRLVKVSLFLVILLSVSLGGAVGLLVLTYARLTDEKPVASLYFDKLRDDEYIAYLATPDGSVDGEYKLFGDQWRMDAEFIKLKPWANIMGMDARYRLTRFEGRYGDIEKENTQPHVAYDLGAGAGIDPGALLVKWVFLIDAEYGSSTFTDIDEDLVYTVYRSQFGLLIRSEPKPDPIGYEPTMLDDIRAWVFGN
ncbi:hypothetical protein LPB41_00170 [Thalassospira sp. MA62]|nr:hypothetical protein [Thalassospira sp. MA62]